MQTIYLHLHLHLPRVHTQRVIDITPLPWWRLAARAALASLIFVVAVPLLWLLGGLFALALVLGTAVMPIVGLVQAARTSRAARRCADPAP